MNIDFEFLTRISNNKSRRHAATELGVYLGAQDLLLFGLDSEIGCFLPVIGFPQTFPLGSKWPEFLNSVLASNNNIKGQVIDEEGKSIDVVGVKVSSSLLYVLVGGKPQLKLLEELHFFSLSLAMILDQERALKVGEGKEKVMQEMSGDLQSFTKKLDRMRQELNEALFMSRNNEKKLEESQLELIEAKLMAESANKTKSSFLANMSHELRSPLGAILGFTELLASPEVAQEEIQEYVSIIKRNSQQVVRIIDDILDLSKVEAGMMTYERVDISLFELLNDVFLSMNLRAKENGIQFSIEKSASTPEYINSDPIRLKQILMNTIGNAIKFTRQGEVKLLVSMEKDMLSFLVKDTGEGIAPENKDKIFSAFTQADTSITRSFGGTGLGLTLTRSLCRAMGGDIILLESELGVGSSFLSKIPYHTPSKNYEKEKQSQFIGNGNSSIEDKDAPLSGMKVLVVEDSADNQLLIETMLMKMGANVDIASNGSEGVEKGLKNKYSVILMDIQMPVMDGKTATKSLRSKGYKGKIIALSAHAFKNEQELSLELGFNNYLTKPINTQTLLNLLTKYNNQD